MKPLLLPKLAFLQAWEWENLGTPPAVIGMVESWMSGDTKHRFEDKVLDVLAEVGVAAGGTLTHDFRDTLAVLASGRRKFTAWAGDVTTGETGGVLVAIDGHSAVRLLREDKVVRIDSLPAEYAAESLVDALPSARPAGLDPVAIPKSEYAAERGYDFEMPTGYDAAERVRTLMAAPRSGMHQLYASSGERRSSPITVVDVAREGRVLTYVSGESMINFLPGTRENLVETLYATSDAMA
ncbi:ESX secretion-associated protein EspG [Amycolatopsis sp. NPDC059657]|uniref:ESX secretion-associated protein EspG n=1 Tax=Amycolatopsis sp. NPDC059657 TaxID=3346899 RepID=UPI00366A7D88